MDPMDRLFGEWTRDLAPGTPDPSRVVRERLLYRSARERSIQPENRFRGDSMEVDRNDFTVPVTRPEPTATSRNQTLGQTQRNRETDSIESVGGICGLEGVESSRAQRNGRQQEQSEPENDNEPSMDIEELDLTRSLRQEEDDLMKIDMDAEEEREEREEEDQDEDEDDGMMSMAMGGLSL